jgi:phosphonate transport system permease protein
VRGHARPYFHEGLTMAETTTSAIPRADIETVREDYLHMTQRRRLYSGVLILIFAVLMISGFDTADGRNAGGFWEGLHRLGDFPADLISEAYEKAANVPGHIVNALPALKCGAWRL